MKNLRNRTITASALAFMTAATLVSSQKACAQVSAAESDAEFSQVEGSKNLSQLIRSNAAHYWAYVGNKNTAQGLRAYEGFKGLVAGDPHLGNFSVIPLTNANGTRSMHEVNIDFDDAGIGPLAYDYARFVITVKAIDDDVKQPALLDAYMLGLSGGEAVAPQVVTDYLSMPIVSYDRLEQEYVDRKTKKGAFKLKEGEIEPYNGSYSRSEIMALFPHEKVLDLASRPKDRGGSVDSERIWVYTERPDGVQKIYELKQYQKTAMEKYSPQADPTRLVPAVRAVFWPNISDDNYQLVSVGSKKTLFWLRDKKVTLFDIPYNMAKPQNKTFISLYAPYVASKLGQAHGAQKAGKELLAAIKKNPEAFKEAVKSVSKEYLKLAADTLGQ
jgi:hypothetical protein